MPPNDHLCLIEPRKGRSEEPLPSSAILVFSPEDFHSFLDCFSHPAKKSHRLYLSNVFTGSFQGTPIAVAGPMLGAPQTILILERMIALGVRRVVAAGWCGSLQENVAIGEIVLPLAAISQEGTSRHYPSKSGAPSANLLGPLRQALAGASLTVHEGSVWTTDAPFRETVAAVRQFQSEGVLAVDMETSALFTVAGFRGIDLAVVLVVSDSLSGLKWSHGFRDPVFKQSRAKLVRSTLEAVCSAAASLTHG